MSRAREASRAAAAGPGLGRAAGHGGALCAPLPSRSSPTSSSSLSCVARGVRAKREGIAPCHAFNARAFGARSAAWHDGRRGARGRRGQAVVDAKARLGDRAFASLRRLRGRTNSLCGRAACGPAGRSGRPLAASPRGTQLIRVRPSRALGLRATAVRRGPKAALGRRDATRRGFTGRDGEGRPGPPPARPVKSDAPPPSARSRRRRPFVLVLGVVVLVLPLLVLCEIVSYASTRSPPGAEPRTAPAGAVGRNGQRSASERAARAGAGDVRHEAPCAGRRSEAPSAAYGRSTPFFGDVGRGSRPGMPVASAGAGTSR